MFNVARRRQTNNARIVFAAQINQLDFLVLPLDLDPVGPHRVALVIVVVAGKSVRRAQQRTRLGAVFAHEIERTRAIGPHDISRPRRLRAPNCRYYCLDMILVIETAERKVERLIAPGAFLDSFVA